MKLQTKLIIVFLVISLLVIAQGITTFHSTQETTRSFEAIVQYTAPAINGLDKMKAAEAALVQEVFSYGLKLQLGVLSGISMVNNQEIQQFQENWGLMEEGLNEYKAAIEVTDTDLATQLRNASMDVYQRGLNYLTLSTQIDDREMLFEAHNALQDINDEFVALLQDALQKESDRLRELSDLSTQNASQGLILNLASSVILISTIVSIGFIVVRTVAKPIRKLERAAQEIAQGDYSQHIDVLTKDEIGQMTISFNAMADAIQKRDLELSELNKTLEQRVIETQQAREQAERSDQVKSAFLASMSHELRTPLNSIINFTSFVVEGDTGPITPEQTELLSEVVKGSRHLLNLINDVLDMSKIEAGSLRLFIEDNISLDTILSRVLATGRSLLANKPIQIILETEALPLIRGDQQRILQILLNIISNACKFTDEGEIKITADSAEDEIVIGISDTGSGISSEERDLIFQVFTQTNSAIRKGGGTGLGMPIAKSLAEAHGGRLWFESQPGKGTTFYVALPIQSEILVPTLEV